MNVSEKIDKLILDQRATSKNRDETTQNRETRDKTPVVDDRSEQFRQLERTQPQATTSSDIQNSMKEDRSDRLVREVEHGKVKIFQTPGIQALPNNEQLLNVNQSDSGCLVDLP